MRSIKCRVWDKKEKKFWYFSPVDGLFATNEEKEEYKKTIQQYTGLHDKNGKECFEGDIIQHWTPKYKHTPKAYKLGNPFVVEWIIARNKNGFNVCGSRNFEVIGNIYQDSHLIL